MRGLYESSRAVTQVDGLPPAPSCLPIRTSRMKSHSLPARKHCASASRTTAAGSHRPAGARSSNTQQQRLATCLEAVPAAVLGSSAQQQRQAATQNVVRSTPPEVGGRCRPEGGIQGGHQNISNNGSFSNFWSCFDVCGVQVLLDSNFWQCFASDGICDI